MQNKSKPKKKKRVLIAALIAVVLLTAAPFVLSSYIVNSAESSIVEVVDSRDKDLDAEVVSELTARNADCILVLGAGLLPDGSPNYMLRDRLETAIALYQAGTAPKLLLSGDHGQVKYDEVNAMKEFALERGVPEEDIFLDHAGFSTYDSMYRAKEVFAVDSAIVVTQQYHQYRALYLGEKLGLDVAGVCSDQAEYVGQNYRNFREIAARDKDFLSAIFKPRPKYLGEVIPISGSGIATHD